jgi:chromosome segregation ATPase
MDDNVSETSANLAAGSAALLRSLEERARMALAASREGVSRLEADITAQLDALSTKLAAEQTDDSPHSGQLEAARSEVERLTQELASSREAWLAERAALERSHERLSQRIAELEAGQDATDSQPAAELDAARDEIEQLKTQLEIARESWQAERSALEQARDELSRRVAEFNAGQGTADSQRKTELDAARTEIERLTRELDSGRAERADLQQACDQRAQQAAQLEANERAAREEWKRQLEEFELRLRDQQSKWNAQQSEWEETRRGLEHERDGLQHKFELALQDVQRLRGRVAELEEELSRRPEASHTDSAELVALRAERDALSERVEQLERQPAPQVDADTAQQLADLQRRFELAVEDVRELKSANSKLEAQLAAAGKRTAAPGEGGALDWEAQKRRLLASLEEESESRDDPQRQQERATIEGTIEMTDAVVADKDREIAELKAQLASGGDRAPAADEEERQRKLDEVIDADEVIAEHRKRIAQIEREMEEKLRAAELELSLERAKIARQKVELDELRADLESQRQSCSTSTAGATPGAPRRRWLSKLGLSGDEQ